MNTKSNKWILAVAAVMVTLMSAPKAMACGEGTDADVVSGGRRAATEIKTEGKGDAQTLRDADVDPNAPKK